MYNWSQFGVGGNQPALGAEIHSRDQFGRPLSWTNRRAQSRGLQTGGFSSSLQAPEFNPDRRLENLRQQEAQKGLRQVRRAAMHGMSLYGDDPSSIYAKEKIVAGLGSGIAAVMQGAHQRAANTVEREYQGKLTAFQVAANREQAAYQAAHQRNLAILQNANQRRMQRQAQLFQAQESQKQRSLQKRLGLLSAYTNLLRG